MKLNPVAVAMSTIGALCTILGLAFTAYAAGWGSVPFALIGLGYVAFAGTVTVYAWRNRHEP